MRHASPHVRSFALCALLWLLGSLDPASASAAFWVVPAGPVSPAGIATALTRAGVGGDLILVMAGLNGAFPIRNQARMVELESGLVRALDAGALQGLSFERDGQLRSLTELLALPGVIVVFDPAARGGAALLVLSENGSVESHALSPDQRALLGEAPCRDGYAPVSFASGTRCEDVDECEAELDDCDGHARCDNTAGGFVCSCRDGYDGDGRECEAVKESSSGGDDAGSGGSSGGGGRKDGGAVSEDAGLGSDDAGSAERDAGARDDARSDGGAGAGGAEEGGRHDGGGCNCDVAGVEPGTLANPVLLSLAWLLRRRHRRPRPRPRPVRT